MSVDLFVFLRQDTLPSLQQWQDSLNALGIDLAFDSTIKVKEHAGYLPANLENVPTGFEFFTGSIADSFPGALPSEVSSCDLVATITTHSDLRELKSAMLAAVALASCSKGFIFDEDTHSVASVEEFLAEATTIDL